MDIEEEMTFQNRSDQDWTHEEASAKLVLEGILLPTISSFGFLGNCQAQVQAPETETFSGNSFSLIVLLTSDMAISKTFRLVFCCDI